MTAPPAAPDRRARLDTGLQARLQEDPWRFDALDLMRRLEAAYPELPRIGRGATLAQDIVVPRQEPFMVFPVSNVTRIGLHPDRAHDLQIRFMGYFGPQGALPLAVTAEAHQWLTRHDDPSFARFADIFATRFVQLFYRAWADARPVVQADRPHDDRFRVWLGALIGLGSPALQDRDSLPDTVRLGLAGPMSGRVRSATRLRQCLHQILEMGITLEEHVGSWLEFDPEDTSRLGQQASQLGQTLCLGTRAYSLSDKLRLTLHCEDLDMYNRYLPGQPLCRRLADFLHGWLGQTMEVEIALSLPAHLVPATRLGQAGQLGWSAFSLSPDTGPDTGPDAAQNTAQNTAPRTVRRVCASFPAHLAREQFPDRKSAA